jgi:hypothetical protein
VDRASPCGGEGRRFDPSHRRLLVFGFQFAFLAGLRFSHDLFPLDVNLLAIEVVLSRLSTSVDTNTLKRVYDDPDYSPTLATLEKLARALGVKIADLIVEDEP